MYSYYYYTAVTNFHCGIHRRFFYLKVSNFVQVTVGDFEGANFSRINIEISVVRRLNRGDAITKFTTWLIKCIHTCVTINEAVIRTSHENVELKELERQVIYRGHPL